MAITWEAVLALLSLGGIVVSLWAVFHSRRDQQADKIAQTVADNQDLLNRIRGWLEGKFDVRF